MTKMKQPGISLIAVALIGGVAGYLFRGHEFPVPQSAIAAESETARQPKADQAPQPLRVKSTADRGVYYPGTEDLKPDEMRVICTGSGMPMEWWAGVPNVAPKTFRQPTRRFQTNRQKNCRQHPI